MLTLDHFTLQINEEDESKASSRNSIHRQHGPREEDEDRNQEETKLTTSGTTVVQECALLLYLALRNIIPTLFSQLVLSCLRNQCYEIRNHIQGDSLGLIWLFQSLPIPAGQLQIWQNWLG